MMQEKNEFNQLVGFSVPNWNKVSEPPRIILQGRFCRVEPINPNLHAEALFNNLAFENLGDSWTYLPYGPFKSCEAFSEWIQQTDAIPDNQLYVIFNAENILVGVAGFLRINPDHGSIEIGHLHFSKLLQRTPAATEAMYLMMRHIFDDLGYRRYEWKCHTYNEPSKKAAVRLGFKFEGVFRQHLVIKNRNRDTAWFSIIDSEWPELKKKFERWLDPANFDANGRQIKNLTGI